MSERLSCQGCKYLGQTGSLCYALDKWERRHNSCTGVVQWVSIGKVEWAEQMRYEQGACGAERRLYHPTLWYRLTGWIERLFA